MRTVENCYFNEKGNVFSILKQYKIEGRFIHCAILIRAENSMQINIKCGGNFSYCYFQRRSKFSEALFIFHIKRGTQQRRRQRKMNEKIENRVIVSIQQSRFVNIRRKIVRVNQTGNKR